MPLSAEPIWNCSLFRAQFTLVVFNTGAWRCRGGASAATALVPRTGCQCAEWTAAHTAMSAGSTASTFRHEAYILTVTDYSLKKDRFARKKGGVRRPS